jgi:hypothetical protein
MGFSCSKHLKGFTTDLEGSSFAMSMDKAKQLQKRH